MQNEIKRKILNIHDYPPKEGGGVEVNTFETNKHLITLGYDTTIATSRLTSETVKNVSNVLVTDEVKLVYLTTVAQLEKLIEEADIVHIHFTFSFRPASMIGLKICVETNKPCIFAFRTVYDHIPFSAVYTDTHLEKDRKFSELKQYLMAPNVYLSGPSNSVNDTLLQLGISKKVQVIRNGCTTVQKNLEAYSEVRRVNLTYVGEISFLKGINYLIDAIKILKKQGMDFSVRLIGGGSDELEMKRLVTYHRLEENIEFTGYIENSLICNYLAKTDFYIHPSLTESWGNAVIEALAMGIPVICTNVGGLTEATNKGRFAILVEPADARDLAKKIHRAFGAKNLVKEKRKALEAMKYVQRKYTFKNQAKQLGKFYESVLKKDNKIC
ncbi:glycosyltransferase [candidate division WWE3 bacterium]|nr:glycosyltransferase [candidate division WWE3 bacterium]